MFYCQLHVLFVAKHMLPYASKFEIWYENTCENSSYPGSIRKSSRRPRQLPTVSQIELRLGHLELAVSFLIHFAICLPDVYNIHMWLVPTAKCWGLKMLPPQSPVKVATRRKEEALDQPHPYQHMLQFNRDKWNNPLTVIEARNPWTKIILKSEKQHWLGTGPQAPDKYTTHEWCI